MEHASLGTRFASGPTDEQIISDAAFDLSMMDMSPAAHSLPDPLPGESSCSSSSMCTDPGLTASFNASLPHEPGSPLYHVSHLDDVDQFDAFDPTLYTHARTLPMSTRGALRCPHPSCSSRVLFTRQCDLNKHYRQHTRKYFCRVPGCGSGTPDCLENGPGSGLGFSTLKDRNRHERGHNPSFPCYICGKLFSREDNLRDHYRKLHRHERMAQVEERLV